MATDSDKEVRAIAAVVIALSDLQNDERARVIDYVSKRFDLSRATSEMPVQKEAEIIYAEAPQVSPSPIMDIKRLREEKKPTSAIQMAVLVTYYLKTLAPTDERTDVVSVRDMGKYFVQAQFPLPEGKNGMADTLNNAQRAGYMESAGRGLYKLNPVGFNLAAYNMPTESVGTIRNKNRGRKNAKKGGKTKSAR